MSVIAAAIGGKILSFIESEIISHEPAIESALWGELQALFTDLLTVVEGKIQALENKV